jgi:hypothetical protein
MQHVSFATDPAHFDALLDRVRSYGVRIVSGPLLSVPPSTWSFYFFDPNGIRLEISTNKAVLAGDALDVIGSCLMSREEMRRELETLSSDKDWVERILESMPQE